MQKSGTVLCSLIERIDSLPTHFLAYEIVGVGFSYAIAKSYAAALRARSRIAYASLPSSRIPNPAVARILVSESARKIFPPPEILITNALSSTHWFEGVDYNIIRLFNNSYRAWLPFEFAHHALGDFRRQAISGTTTRTKPVTILLFERHGEIARDFINAASDKIGNHKILALDISEFGHGRHYQLLQNPSDYEIFYFSPSQGEDRKWQDIRSWLANNSVDTTVNSVTLEGVTDSTEYVLNVGAATLAVLEELCESASIEIYTPPIPANIDNIM